MLPRTTKAEWENLARLQRSFDRKDEGSKNREKVRKKLAGYYAYLARRRFDAAHKATTYIAKNHGVIVIEDLRIKNITASAAGIGDDPGENVAQKSGLNRSILDVASDQIRSMLAYKCQWYGLELRTTPAPYASQRCNLCTHVAAVNRKKSVFLCIACGNEDDADLNASDNTRAGGLPVIAYASTQNTNEFVRC